MPKLVPMRGRIRENAAEIAPDLRSILTNAATNGAKPLHAMLAVLVGTLCDFGLGIR